jgi:hypothetical protein
VAELLAGDGGASAEFKAWLFSAAVCSRDPAVSRGAAGIVARHWPDPVLFGPAHFVSALRDLGGDVDGFGVLADALEPLRDSLPRHSVFAVVSMLAAITRRPGAVQLWLSSDQASLRSLFRDVVGLANDPFFNRPTNAPAAVAGVTLREIMEALGTVLGVQSLVSEVIGNASAPLLSSEIASLRVRALPQSGEFARLRVVCAWEVLRRIVVPPRPLADQFSIESLMSSVLKSTILDANALPDVWRCIEICLLDSGVLNRTAGQVPANLSQAIERFQATIKHDPLEALQLLEVISSVEPLQHQPKQTSLTDHFKVLQ